MLGGAWVSALGGGWAIGGRDWAGRARDRNSGCMVSGCGEESIYLRKRRAARAVGEIAEGDGKSVRAAGRDEWVEEGKGAWWMLVGANPVRKQLSVWDALGGLRKRCAAGWYWRAGGLAGVTTKDKLAHGTNSHQG